MTHKMWTAAVSLAVGAGVSLGSLCVEMVVPHVAQAQAFECGGVGDACVVAAGDQELRFSGIGSGADNVVLGRLNFLIYNTLVACVNGTVQFSTDWLGLLRDRQGEDSVVCTDGGNDTIRVLSAGETFSCRFLGLPIDLYPWNYNGFELKLLAGSGADVVRGGDGTDRICAGSGNDKIYGRAGTNELNGGTGNDYLEGDRDIDWMFGELGDDILVDVGTGGYRNYCLTTPSTQRTPSRMDGGDGNDCIDVPSQTEPGWCFRQEEACGGSTGVVCNQGLYCGPGASDRMNTDSAFGTACEIRTNGIPCPRM